MSGGGGVRKAHTHCLKPRQKRSAIDGAIASQQGAHGRERRGGSGGARRGAHRAIGDQQCVNPTSTETSVDVHVGRAAEGGAAARAERSEKVATKGRGWGWGWGVGMGGRDGG